MGDVSGEARYRLMYNLGCAFSARIEIEYISDVCRTPRCKRK
jgi:hypothetical protein